MIRADDDMRGPGRWFAPVVWIFLATTVIFVGWAAWPKSRPENAVRDYVDALSNQQCKKAYKLVSYNIKVSISAYSTYDGFKQTICDTVSSKYKTIRVFRIDKVVENMDAAIVNYRLEYKTSFMTVPQNRPSSFIIHRDGHRWKIDGPALEL
jgi:hypothetical protein